MPTTPSDFVYYLTPQHLPEANEPMSTTTKPNWWGLQALRVKKQDQPAWKLFLLANTTIAWAVGIAVCTRLA